MSLVIIGPLVEILFVCLGVLCHLKIEFRHYAVNKFSLMQSSISLVDAEHFS